MVNENIELAEEHIKIAEDLVNKETKKCCGNCKCSKEKEKNLLKAQFSLEEAEANLDESEKE